MSINIEELTQRKTSERFPNVVITSPNDTVPVVVRTLMKGDMQLIIEFEGKRKVVASISPSAFNIDKLLRTVGKISYSIAPESQIEIDDVTTYLSCL